MFQRFGSFQAQQGNNKALHPQSQNDRLVITVTASTTRQTVTSYSFCCPFMAAWSHSSSLCCFTSPSISCHKQYLYYSSCHHHQHLFCRLPDSQRSAQSFILHCVLRFAVFFSEELKALNTTDMLHFQDAVAKHYCRHAHKSLYVTGLL